MAPSVRISHRDAERLLGIIELAENLGVDISPFQRVSVESLRRALEPRPKSSAVRKTERKKRAKSKTTKQIRAEVMRRAQGLCECCHEPATELNPLELDHFHGRGRFEESGESTWALKRDHHRAKTENRPDAQFWLEAFISHSKRHGFTGAARWRAESRLDALRLSGRATP